VPYHCNSAIHVAKRRGALAAPPACAASDLRGHFRNPCRSQLRSHLAATQPSPKNRPTCFEGPFGELIRATGAMAKANPFRFSTKYQDDETDMLYYGYRYEKDGKWLNRDPLGEPGFEELRRRKSNVFGDGPNLYAFVGNAPVNRIDAFGLTRVESMAWFPGSVFDGLVYWADVDDDQFGTVALNRITMAEVEAEMRDLVSQLDGFEKRDGCKSRKYEGGFDSKYFAGENQQHQYYLVDAQGPLYADNQINYIGIGLYEAWFCDSLTKAKAIVWLWKLGRWQDVPSAGTMHWLEVGYNNYKTIKGNNNTSEQQGRCCRRCNTDSDRRDGSR
jgi:RHS repeat-associated protein